MHLSHYVKRMQNFAEIIEGIFDVADVLETFLTQKVVKMLKKVVISRQ